MNEEPIISPYGNAIPDMPPEMLDKIKKIVNDFGFIDVFIAAHGKDVHGKCFWNGYSSIQSECLKNYIKSVGKRMEDESIKNEGEEV